MPTSKDDAEAIAADRDSVEYDRFCKSIDSVIADRFGTSLPLTVSTARVPKEVVSRAVSTYSTLGWRCQVVPDQRDGDYLHLR